MENNVSFKDRLMSIVDKELALNNAVKELNYEKVKNLLEKAPEVLLSKHLKLSDNLGKNSSLTKEQSETLSLIGLEINYVADKNFANYYAHANGLNFENPNVALRTELNSDPPCNKEPLIHYVSKGADVTMMTNDNLDRKLQDIGFTEIGGQKVLEKDKQDLINFATITAIKKDDIGAFKHLDNEFKITENQSNALEFALYSENNNAYKIQDYLTSLNKENTINKDISQPIPEFTGNDNSYKNEIKTNSIEETKKLVKAIINKDFSKIENAIMNGALVNYPKINECIKKHDEEDRSHIVMTVFNSIKERNEKIPENLKYKFDFKETLKLQEAAVKGNAMEAYNALKNGADPKGITKNNYTHLSNDVKTTFENAVVKGYQEHQQQFSKSHNNTNSLGI